MSEFYTLGTMWVAPWWFISFWYWVAPTDGWNFWEKIWLGPLFAASYSYGDDLLVEYIKISIINNYFCKCTGSRIQSFRVPHHQSRNGGGSITAAVRLFALPKRDRYVRVRPRGWLKKLPLIPDGSTAQWWKSMAILAEPSCTLFIIPSQKQLILESQWTWVWLTQLLRRVGEWETATSGVTQLWHSLCFFILIVTLGTPP